MKTSLAAAAGLTLGNRLALAAGEKPKPENVLTPAEAWKRLKEGNARYVAGKLVTQDLAAERQALATGQNPFAGVLTCADSRVAPEYVYDTGLGDLFVVRVAGNFADEEALASFEYAVKFLGTPLIVVMGHEKCGAVEAAIKAVTQHAELPGHLPGLVEHLRPAVETAVPEKAGELLANATRDNVVLQVESLRKASPILQQYVSDGKLLVVGGVYKLASGEVEWVTA